MNQVIVVNVGRETLELALPLVAATCFWSGILNIARGVSWPAEYAAKAVVSIAAVSVSGSGGDDPDALGCIAANITINVFGLGSAATPSGLKAMECMQRHNPDKKTASRAMVTFLVLNTAGVTILSTTIVSLRAQFGALNPTDFMPLAIIATSCASIGGLALDRWVNYRGK